MTDVDEGFVCSCRPRRLGFAHEETGLLFVVGTGLKVIGNFTGSLGPNCFFHVH
jgi:hypothetical protein